MLWLIPSALAAPEPFAGCDNSDAKWVMAHNDGTRALEAEDLQAAVRGFRKALERQPGCRADLEALSATLFRLADPGAAAVAIEGVRRFPDDPAFPLLYAQVAFAAQDFPTALDAARRARTIDPTDFNALYQVVTVLVRLGDYAGAEREIAGGGFPEAESACARVWVLADQELYDEARAQLKVCEGAADPRYASVVRSALPESIADGSDLPGGEGVRARLVAANAGSDALEKGDYATAETIYEQLLKEEPWNSAWRACYAASLLGAGKKAKARKELDALFEAETWITIDPSGAITGVTTKGREVALDRSLEQALGLLVRSLADDKSFDDAHTALRKAEARFGRTPDLLVEELHLTKVEKGNAEAWKVAPGMVHSWPLHERLLFETSSLVFDDAAHAPADVLDLLVAGGNSPTLHNTVAGLANARAPGCTRVALAALPRMPADEKPKARAMAYQCALAAPDLAAAGAVLATGTDGLTIQDRSYHAYTLHKAGRTQEAEALARTVVTDTTADEQALYVLSEAARARGDQAEQVRLARHPSAPDFMKLNAAITLFNSGKYADARTFTDTLDCAAQGEDAKLCGDLKGALEGRK